MRRWRGKSKRNEPVSKDGTGEQYGTVQSSKAILQEGSSKESTKNEVYK